MLLLLFLILFSVGCSNKDESIDQGGYSQSENSRDDYKLGSKEIEVEDDFKNKPGGKDFYYGDIENSKKVEDIELSDKYVPDNITIYETPDFEDAMENSGFIDNNELYGDLIIHSENRLDVIYEIYKWTINEIANDGFSRLGASTDEEGLNNDTRVKVEVSTWASRLETSLQKLTTYSILIHANYDDIPTLVEKWESFENKLSNKTLILRNIKTKEDVERYTESLEITECNSVAYNLAEEILRVLNEQDYINEKRMERLNETGNITEEEMKAIEEYYYGIDYSTVGIDADGTDGVISKPTTNEDSADTLDDVEENEDNSDIENRTDKPSTLSNMPTTNGEGLTIE